MPVFDFFRGNEAEQYMFYRVPQILFTDEKFKSISSDAKLLYGFLLDRTSLSQKNNWCDKNNCLYVYFTLDEAREKLNIGTGKAVKIFDELEKIGLIIRKKQGQGNPTKIFVMNFAKQGSQTSKPNTENQAQTSKNRKSEKFESKTEVKTCENRKSRLTKNESIDFQKSKPIHTNRTILTESDLHQSYLSRETEQKQKSESLKNESDGWTDEEREEKIEDIKFQIDYENLIYRATSDDKNYRIDLSVETIDLIVDILLEAHNPKIPEITINGQTFPKSVVLAQYSKIESEHIDYIATCIKETTKKHRIKNLRSYLRTCLYNAPHTMALHYDNEYRFYFSNED